MLAPKSIGAPVFLLEDRQTMWGSVDSGKTWKTLWKLEGTEQVSRATECGDGRVAILTGSRLLVVKNFGQEVSKLQISSVALEALGLSLEGITRLSCAEVPTITLNLGGELIYSPESVAIPCG